jgi:hypothetical protein
MAISPLTGSSTFYDWYIKTNDEIIAQLNAMTIYGATSGDGVRLDVDGNGILSATIGGTSGNIQSGLTFSGKVSFTGEVAVPNVSFKIDGITTGTPGYGFGSIIRTDGINGYTLACADDPDNAESLAVISGINSKYSIATVLGKITGDFNTVAGGTLFPGCVYFLDPTVPGKITTTEPVTVGQVSKPIIMGVSGDSGIVLQYRGNYLNGSSTIGLSGGNRIYVILPSTSTSNGFVPGNFVSYLPNVGSYGSSFNSYLTATGRTAYSGWFMSQSTSVDQTSPLPFEEDFVVGMIETSNAYGADRVYQIVTKGATEVVPAAISPSVYGWWVLNGATLPNQLVQSSNNIEENNPFERLYVGYNYNDTSFIVDIKPQLKSVVNGRSTTLPVSDQTITAFQNETFNGDFSVWQRSTARDSQYTSNTSKVYFADQWVRRTSRTALVSQYIERKTFSKSQILVEGTPANYIDVKCIVDPSSIWLSGHHSVGHIIPNIESLNNSNITVSFYAKSTNTGYSTNVYFARYNGSTLVSKTVIGTVSPTTTWNKYTINYKVPVLSSGSYENDYVEIGFDMEPMVKSAFDASVALGTSLYMSFASLCVYNGTYLNPKHLFESQESKQVKANKFYYTTYSDSQVEATTTLASNNSDIALNAISTQYTPQLPYSTFKLPVKMRTSPTVSVYSPSTGASNDAFNLNAGLDLRNTSGTIGYDRKTRIAPLNNSTITSTADQTTVKINFVNGVVPYDTVSYHLIADASYPL